MKNFFHQLSIFLAKVKQIFLDVIFPINCLGCGAPDRWLCPECEKKLPRRDNLGEIMDWANNYLEMTLIASEWQEELVQKIIHAYKYNFVQELAPVLGRLLITKVKLLMDLYPELKDFILMPVPLHKKRWVWRGFNQAELLAKQIADEYQMKIMTDCLKRIKNTRPQVKLNSQARHENIINAFVTNNNLTLAGKSVLLIDDVMTTGATMNECAKVLKQAGVSKVWALAIARG